MPLPLMPRMGLGRKVAWRPWFRAIRFTTHLKVAMLSAVVRASAYLKSISCCPGATSWWAASISKPMATRAFTMSRRASSPLSMGARSK